jgi:hypothetical protein
MNTKIGIYLAGSIKKGHENPQESFWTDKEITCLQNSFQKHEAIFLNPAFRKDNLSDAYSVFGRDMVQVFCSHVVFVDARDRRGLGVGAEMMWAKLNKIPVVTWAPKESHYHKTKTTLLGVEVEHFIHPFIYALSDQIVETLEEGAVWIEKTLADPSTQIKGVESIQAAMQYYQEKQLPVDEPMQEILSCDAIHKRLMRPCIQREEKVHSL